LTRVTDIIKAFIKGITMSKVSIIGAAMTTISFPIILIAVIIDLQGMIDNPYFGFVIYMILGPTYIIGLVLVFIGVFFLKGKKEIGVFTFAYLKEQFTNPDKFSRVQKLIFLGTFLTIVNIFIVMLFSYTGYHYTESIGFCGKFCHTVMMPEYTAYQNSPHSRVSCVECHIGSGAQWFAKSKISGVRQLFAVALGTYSRPIETPVHGLRPARETCEECHRPELFHGDNLVIKDKYLDDEENSHVQTVLLMKIGSGGYRGERAHGIHWHVSDENKIIYTHSDRARQDITEVKLVKPDGTQVVFAKDGDDSNTGSGESAGVHGEKTMDCIDCHNRPTHIYLTADEALNQKFANGELPREVPFIKRQALEAINVKYESSEAAQSGIETALTSWYQKNYSEFVKDHNHLFGKAVKAVQLAYAENVFPSMKIEWGQYQSFLGHQNDSGCFRCHDDSHTTKAGESISQDCETCHLILAEDEPAPEVIKMLKNE
jgi:hypothetical protein